MIAPCEKYPLLRLPTPLERMKYQCDNHLFIKRDDLTDFALGGNKARKMEFFLADALRNNSDCLVTYGSKQSNHCRIVAAAACRFGMKCILILEYSGRQETLTGNSIFYRLANARTIVADVNDVKDTIDRTLESLRREGKNPYFIPGGGHSPLGTHAYVEAWREIQEQSASLGLSWDYIFHASGTGTTQAGLILGNHFGRKQVKIIGISVARKVERAVSVIRECLEEYRPFFDVTIGDCSDHIHVTDDYLCGGYGKISQPVIRQIAGVFNSDSIVLDPTYTGKAFWGMVQYLKNNNIQSKNILFLHTGGLPCLFSAAGLFHPAMRSEGVWRQPSRAPNAE